MKVLLTGGTGFIGAWIIKRLAAAGHAVRVFDIRGEQAVVRSIAGNAVADAAEWLVGDISQRADVDRAVDGCDRVIHLAGVLTPVCQADPARGAAINLIGTLNVFAAARAAGMPSVVYASSAGVFGPVDGTHPAPTTHYGTFKLACEGSARAYWEDHRFPSIGFRPFVVYGPGREVGMSAGPSLACRAAARGQAYTMPFTGASGMVYVDDVAEAFVRAIGATMDGARIFNLVGDMASADEIFAGIRAVVPDAQLAASGPPLPIAPDINEEGLSELMGDWRRTSLASGLKDTIAFYRCAGG